MKKLILSLFTLFFSTLIIAQIDPELPFDFHDNFNIFNTNNIKSIEIVEFKPQFGIKELDSVSKLYLIKNKVVIDYDSINITKLYKEDKEYRSVEQYELLYDSKGRIIEKILSRSSSSDKEIYKYNENDNSAIMFYYNDYKRKKNLTKYDKATKYKFQNNKVINEITDDRYSKDETIYKYNIQNDLIYRKGLYVTTTFTYIYDNQSRQTKKREQNSAGLDRTETYSYNKNGLLVKLNNSNAKSNSRSETICFYDENNYLIRTETKGQNKNYKIEEQTNYTNDIKGNWLKREIFRDNELKYYFERTISYKSKKEE